MLRISALWANSKVEERKKLLRQGRQEWQQPMTEFVLCLCLSQLGQKAPLRSAVGALLWCGLRGT